MDALDKGDIVNIVVNIDQISPEKLLFDKNPVPRPVLGGEVKPVNENRVLNLKDWGNSGKPPRIFFLFSHIDNNTTLP